MIPDEPGSFGPGYINFCKSRFMSLLCHIVTVGQLRIPFLMNDIFLYTDEQLPKSHSTSFMLHKCQGWSLACAQPMRDIVTNLHRLSLAGHKPRISPVSANERTKKAHHITKVDILSFPLIHQLSMLHVKWPLIYHSLGCGPFLQTVSKSLECK